MKIGAVARRSFEPSVRSLVDHRFRPPAIVEPMLRARASLRDEFTRLHKFLLDAVRSDLACCRPMTVVRH